MAKIYNIKNGQLIHDDRDDTVESYYEVLEQQLDDYLAQIKAACLELASESPNYSFSEMVFTLPDKEHGDSILLHNPAMSVSRLREIVKQGYEKSKTV